MITDFDNSKRKYYKTRPSYLYRITHINDFYLHLGYKYKNNVLKNSTSTALWTNPNQSGMYMQLENMIVFLIDRTKMVKKWFSIAHDKNTLNIN